MNNMYRKSETNRLNVEQKNMSEMFDGVLHSEHSKKKGHWVV